jgi:hypothetical protein
MRCAERRAVGGAADGPRSAWLSRRIEPQASIVKKGVAERDPTLI